MVYNKWCDSRNVTILSRHCSPDLEFITVKCRPFYLPREFTSVIVTAVYIPPQADTDKALMELYGTLNKHQIDNVDAAVIVAGDLRPASKTFLSVAPEGERTLDHCYTEFKEGYKAQSLPPFSKSDHAAVFLMPRYRQKLQHEPPAMREIQLWSEQSESLLQDVLDSMDWDMFRRSSDDSIKEFTETVLAFIGKLVDDVVPKVTTRTYPNQKPWVNHSIREAEQSHCCLQLGAGIWEHGGVQSCRVQSKEDGERRQMAVLGKDPVPV